MQSSHELPVEMNHPVVLVDGPAEAKAWFGSFISAAAAGSSQFEHPHPDMPAARITFARLCDAIAATHVINGRPWSVAEDGYPPVGGPVVMMSPPGSDPTRGSASHNLLHRLLGDFH